MGPSFRIILQWNIYGVLIPHIWVHLFLKIRQTWCNYLILILILHSKSIILYHLHRSENVKRPDQSIYQYLILHLGLVGRCLGKAN